MSTSQPSLVLCEMPETGRPGIETFSPFCLKARRALAVAGLAYTSRREADPGAFARLSPVGQVPILLVGDEVVADSTRILARIEALAPGSLEGGLDARARAEAWLWEELADTALNGFLVAARWGDERTWEAVRAAYFGRAPWFVRAVIVPRIRARVLRGLHARDVLRAGPEACWARLERALDQLDARAPAEGFWVGARLSVADLALFAQLQSLRTDLTPWQAAEVEKRPRLRAYLDRVDRRTGPAAEAPSPRAAHGLGSAVVGLA